MSPVDTLARALAGAWRSSATLAPDEMPAAPADADEAFAVQHRLLERLGEHVVAWKVGAKTPGAAPIGAPLPGSRTLQSPARVVQADFPVIALELELAFSFSRTFAPDRAWSDDDVIAAIGTVRPAIEIVSSRHAAWPDVDPLLQLADLQSHGALILGSPVPYAAFIAGRPDGGDLSTSDVRFSIGTHVIASGSGSNPAGDPRRLLPWFVNHCARRGIAVGPELVVTTGSYTGAWRCGQAGTVRGTIAGLNEVVVHID